MAHGACDRCGCAREECECGDWKRTVYDRELIETWKNLPQRPQAELDREEVERRGYPHDVDYEALILAEAEDIE